MWIALTFCLGLILGLVKLFAWGTTKVSTKRTKAAADAGRSARAQEMTQLLDSLSDEENALIWQIMANHGHVETGRYGQLIHRNALNTFWDLGLIEKVRGISPGFALTREHYKTLLVIQAADAAQKRRLRISG